VDADDKTRTICFVREQGRVLDPKCLAGDINEILRSRLELSMVDQMSNSGAPRAIVTSDIQDGRHLVMTDSGVRRKD
jgi:hypothetical protein